MKKSDRVKAIREGLRRFNRRAGVLKSDPYGLGLSLSQSSALVEIERLGSLRSSDVVRLLNLEKSSVSRLIAVLVEKGLVIVKGDPADGRANVLSLTAQGRKAVETIHERSNESVEEVLDFLTLDEQEEMAAAFEKLSGAVEKAAQKTAAQNRAIGL